MSKAAFQVGFDVEAAPFYRYIDDLDRRTGDKTMKQILRNVGTKVYVPKLRAHADHYSQYKYSAPTRNLRRSFGNITGKSKRASVIFVGPRMSTAHNRGSGHKGWVTNILENVQGPKMKSAPGPRRRSHFKKVHLSLIPKAQADIARAVKWAVEKRWR